MEDFAPYELAVKLNEVGFNYDTKEVYEVDVLLERYFEIPKPTISQVLKWLREKKKIFIDIRTSIDLNGKEHFSYYIIHNKVSIREGYTDFDWKFEQAAIAGIEYVIDNLI